MICSKDVRLAGQGVLAVFCTVISHGPELTVSNLLHSSCSQLHSQIAFQSAGACRTRMNSSFRLVNVCICLQLFDFVVDMLQ
jgi:hypothetical protein